MIAVCDDNQTFSIRSVMEILYDWRKVDSYRWPAPRSQINGNSYGLHI